MLCLLCTVHGALQSLNLSEVSVTLSLESKLITLLQSVATLQKLILSDCCLSHAFGLFDLLLFLIERLLVNRV